MLDQKTKENQLTQGHFSLCFIVYAVMLILLTFSGLLIDIVQENQLVNAIVTGLLFLGLGLGFFLFPDDLVELNRRMPFSTERMFGIRTTRNVLRFLGVLCFIAGIITIFFILN